MNTGEVKAMIAARSNLTAGCCSSRFHFLASTQTVTAFIAAGALGRLRVARCRVIKPAGPPPSAPPPAWRLNRSLNGGGIMSNWGCYDLDYLLGVTGWSLHPQRVLAQMWPVPEAYLSHIAPGSDAETHLAALIRCADGVTITYERGEYVAAQAEESWQIIGDRGSLRLQMTPGKGKTIVFDRADSIHGVVSEVIWQGDEEYGAIPSSLLDDFALAIRAGRQPQTDLEKALVVQAITDAIYTSALRGTEVSIER
jgi:predicted dehydrogenase